MRQTHKRSLLEAEVTPVYRFALRLTRDIHLAEDLTQDAMLRAWKARRRMPRGGDGEIRPWLFRITRNLWIDESRRRSVRQRTNALGRVPETADEAASHDALALLDQLPPRQREVLYLSACEGLTPTQIGRVLNISPEAAKASASVARAKLRTLDQQGRQTAERAHG